MNRRARLACGRSISLKSSMAGGCRTGGQVPRDRVSRPEIHLVGRLAAKRRMGQHAVVLIDVERHEATDRGGVVQRMQEQPLMFI